MKEQILLDALDVCKSTVVMITNTTNKTKTVKEVLKETLDVINYSIEKYKDEKKDEI